MIIVLHAYGLIDTVIAHTRMTEHPLPQPAGGVGQGQGVKPGSLIGI